MQGGTRLLGQGIPYQLERVLNDDPMPDLEVQESSEGYGEEGVSRSCKHTSS